MKKLIPPLLLIPLCILLMLGSMLFLAETYPFSAGDPLFALQHSAEQARLRLAPSPAQQARFAVELAQRRLADLAKAELYSQTELAALAFDHSLAQAAAAYQSAPESVQNELLLPLEMLLNQAEVVVAAFTPAEPGSNMAALSATLAALLSSEPAPADASPGQSAQQPTRISGEVISFLGREIDHQDFPLSSGHADLECMACHFDGQYKFTPTQCSLCHALPSPANATAGFQPDEMALEPVYPNHFAGECSDCHDIASWLPTEFDHRDILECQSCHADDLPALAAAPEMPMTAFISFEAQSAGDDPLPPDHYPGDCMLCHTDTQDWTVWEYEHTGVKECASCHAWETPIPHLPGTCVACHEDVSDWNIAIVDHSGYTDCLACHAEDKPEDHYPGICASCHTTEAWVSAVFSHAGYTDCRSCHDKPVKHYTGQCSNCHDQATWIAVNFKHKDFGDCMNCHSNDRPSSSHYITSCGKCHNITHWADWSFNHTGGLNCQQCHSAPGGHYAGQCSNCHNTTRWAQATMDHTGYSDCEACHSAPAGHYAGQCSVCHNVQDWSDGAFVHNASADCFSCHTGDAPAAHYFGQCSFCHNTSNWADYWFNHEGFVDCVSCHTLDAPAGHYGGQCSDCHSTGNWANVTFNHSGYTDCASCHTIDGHWPGQCSSCHNTTDWSNVNFDHTGYTNCKSCHGADRPASHPRGQCSNCHSTDTWIVGTPTPTALPAFASPFATPEPPSSRLFPHRGRRYQLRRSQQPLVLQPPGGRSPPAARTLFAQHSPRYPTAAAPTLTHALRRSS